MNNKMKGQSAQINTLITLVVAVVVISVLFTLGASMNQQVYDSSGMNENSTYFDSLNATVSDYEDNQDNAQLAVFAVIIGVVLSAIIGAVAYVKMR